MKLKSALAIISLSLLCLVPTISFADTLQLTGVGGASADGVYTYPYEMTLTGPGGTETLAMSCLNFDRDITFNESWTVVDFNVLSIPTNVLDGFTENQFLEDALLFNQYAGASAQRTLDIQFAIWSIMDPAITLGNPDAFNTNASNLAQAAFKAVVTDRSTLDTTQFANDEVFIPVDGTQSAGGIPQIFMVDPPPSVMTPEPASLLLFGTGFIGVMVTMRGRLLKSNG
jgi:hypothetical protein